jgi:hypothetical protein
LGSRVLSERGGCQEGNASPVDSDEIAGVINRKPELLIVQRAIRYRKSRHIENE